MNEDRTLSLSQLTAEAEVSPRTIRYYIAEGLLRSPGAGPQARYGASHVDRIRLIKQLQRSHLPLAEIRNRLSHLSDEQVSSLAAAHDAPLPDTSALDYVRDALASHVAEPLGVRETPYQAPGPMPSRAFASQAAPGPIPTPPPDRSHWERVSLDPDIELHIRRPLTRQHNRAVGRIIGTAREILEEETR